MGAVVAAVPLTVEGSGDAAAGAEDGAVVEDSLGESQREMSPPARLSAAPSPLSCCRRGAA